jgi:hypothetical protein
MVAYEIAEVPFNDTRAQEHACAEYLEKIIKTKHPMLIESIGHSTFKDYLKILNSRMDYQTLVQVMEYPEFYF